MRILTNPLVVIPALAFGAYFIWYNAQPSAASSARSDHSWRQGIAGPTLPDGSFYSKPIEDEWQPAWPGERQVW